MNCFGNDKVSSVDVCNQCSSVIFNTCIRYDNNSVWIIKRVTV